MFRYTDKEIKEILREAIVVVDTREQKCGHIIEYFNEKKIPYVCKKLDFGDYTLKVQLPHLQRPYYLQNQCVIERKANLNELSGNFTQSRERIEGEFLRAKGIFYLLIENARYQDILNHNYNTKYLPQSFIGTLKAFEARYNLKITFLDDTTYSGDFIYRTLQHHLRELLKKERFSMKKWNGYETTQVIGEKKKLPAGGYVCHILDAKEEIYGWGSVLVISFDIKEGQYKNFYREQYDKQKSDKKWKGTYRLNCPKDNGDEKDERTKRNFKTFIYHIEKSNSGYKWDWDENTLKGKDFGGIFGEKEYEIEGNTGFYTTLRYTTDTESVKTAMIPKPILLKKQAQPVVTTQIDWEDETLPF